MIPKVIVVALAVQFRIDEPIKAATRILNFHAIVDNRSQAAFTSTWLNTEEPMANINFVVNQARIKGCNVLKDYGIHLESLDLVSCGEGMVLKNVNDWSCGDNPKGTRPE